MEEKSKQVSSSFFNHPLFSCFITLYTLLLIYDSLRFFLSPVLLISSVLLLSLLRLGSTRESSTRPEKIESMNLEEVKDKESLVLDFVEWNLKAPLEVIHESYEDDEENEPTRFKEIENFPSLCYPESDSDSSSSEFNFPEMGQWNLPEFRWEEEEEEEDDDGIGLIEIKLDHNSNKIRSNNKWNQTEFDFQAEEDGLIEIDLFL